MAITDEVLNERNRPVLGRRRWTNAPLVSSDPFTCQCSRQCRYSVRHESLLGC